MNPFCRYNRILVCVGILLCGLVGVSDHLLASENQVPYKSIHYNFYDVFFLDSETGWLCGKAGLVYRTDDGGMTWERLSLESDDSIFGIYFMDQNRGFLAGQSGLLMGTEDGGGKWQKIDSPVDKTFLTLDFFDDQTGMAAGDWGKIIRTNDGGKTWENISLEEDILLYDIKFTGPEEIWIAAELGAIFHSTDGGDTWEKKQVADGTLFGIDFDGRGNGLAVGVEGSIMRSTDYGETWEDAEQKTTRESLYNVIFSEDTVVAIGDAGTILINRHLDKFWHQLEIPDYMRANWLQAIAELEKEKFIVAGARGSISFIEEGKFVRPDITK